MPGEGHNPAPRPSQKIEFYDLDPSILTKPGRDLIREYAGVPDQDINRHVEAVRQKAFQVRPYPCIGMFQFLDLSLSTTEVYQEILERVKQGEKFLDLGCCFGQEIRKLVFDGAPSVNTYGCDLWGDFFSAGYELFRDQSQLKTLFIAADVFDDTSPLLQLAGQINIIYTGAFFHLFSLEEQERAARRVIQLLAPQKDSLIVGRQSGSENAGEISRSGDKEGRKHFQHNAQSWKELWNRVGEQTGSKWLVRVDLDSPEFTLSVPGEKSEALQRKMTGKGLRFTMRRL